MSFLSSGAWDPRVIAAVAVSGFALSGFIGCFVSSWFCRWPKSSGSGSDALRLFMLPAALLCYILWSCLDISSLVISQLLSETSPSYQIVYIFEELSTLLAEILLVLIIHQILYRRLDQQGIKDGFITATRYITLALISVSFVVGLAVVGIRAKSTAVYIRYVDDGYDNSVDYFKWALVDEKVVFAYELILLVVLVQLFGFLTFKVWRTSAKAESRLTLVAILAFFVQQLDDAVTDGYFATGGSSNSSEYETLNFSYSNTIIYNIMALVVVVCLVIVGIWSKNQMRDGKNTMPAQYNHNYPNYPTGNNGVGYVYNQQNMQQQYYQPQNLQPYPQEMPHSREIAYKYPIPQRPGELPSGIENQQFPNPPTSPQMLYAPPGQPYRA